MGQLVGQMDQLAETLVHLPPPSPKAAFATRAQGQAAQTVVQPAAQQHQPPPTAAQAPASRPEAPGVGVIPRTPGPSPGASDGTASREESWRFEMLDAINQMLLMLNLQETNLFRMARAAQQGPHSP